MKKRYMLVAAMALSTALAGAVPANAEKPRICIGGDDPDDPTRIIGYCVDEDPEALVNEIEDAPKWIVTTVARDVLDLDLPPIPPTP